MAMEGTSTLGTGPGSNLPVVIDVGTGYTKMGYAGNTEPSYIIPTVLGLPDPKVTARTSKGVEDLAFLSGFDAHAAAGTHTVQYPVKHGQIEDWDLMERFWEHCFFKYLKCEPEDHPVVLTEPPLNAPENREYTAEIMFETFNVPSLHIAVQAVLALIASWRSKKAVYGSLTGTVVDCGDGVTHVIPVVEGYVIPSAIRHIPLAGRDITDFVQGFMRDRERAVIPPEESLAIAMDVKERFGYVCKDLAKEYAAFDAAPAEHIQQYHGIHPRTKKPYTVDVAYEQFLGPELFFHPEIFSSDFTTPLPQVVDNCIQSCPIDTRRALYGNVVLSGGTTMFRAFGKRMQRDVKSIVDRRLAQFEATTKVGVNVVSHATQRYAVWFGGSFMAMMPQFESVCISKADYDEVGPSVARQSKVFESITM